MALLAKKSGIVRSWPIPMNRSRDLTMHAMFSENVANSAEPRTTIATTSTMGDRIHAQVDADEDGHERDDHGLRACPVPPGERLAAHEGHPRRGAHEQLLHDPEVALPDHRDAVEDRAEEAALGQDAGVRKSR